MAKIEQCERMEVLYTNIENSMQKKNEFVVDVQIFILNMLQLRCFQTLNPNEIPSYFKTKGKSSRVDSTRDGKKEGIKEGTQESSKDLKCSHWANENVVVICKNLKKLSEDADNKRPHKRSINRRNQLRQQSPNMRREQR